VRHEALMKGGVGIDIKALALAYGRKGRAHLALRWVCFMAHVTHFSV
jgi:hypothetical protein